MSPPMRPPFSSTMNMRSASPSKAAPRSQPSIQHGFLQVDHVVGFDRTGGMVGKRSVEFEEERRYRARQMAEDVRHGQARHAVACVDRDLERFDRVAARRSARQCSAKSSSTLRSVIGRHAAGRSPRSPRAMRSRIADSPVSSEIACARVARELHPVIVGGIVRRRDHDAAGIAVFADGEIQRVGRNEADVGDVGAGLGCAARKRFEQDVTRRAHVAPDGDRRRAEFGYERAADGVRQIGVDFGRIDASYVVAFEDVGNGDRRHVARASGRPAPLPAAPTRSGWRAARHPFANSGHYVRSGRRPGRTERW